MADQCIVCLEVLEVSSLEPASTAVKSPLERPPEPPPADAPSGAAKSATIALSCDGGPSTKSINSENHEDVAVIQVCGHTLHDSCLREWTSKANSCPICRQAFHLVNVYDCVGGTLLSTYTVEDKKQVADFDPLDWMDQNPDEEDEEERPCPVCESAEHEEVLLMCESCDANYHTFCVGLDDVPAGRWYCFECVEQMEDESDEEAAEAREPIDDMREPTAWTASSLSRGRRSTRSSNVGARRRFAGTGTVRSGGFFPRTRARARRVRRNARSDAWQGAWGQIAGRVYDAINLDLDNHEGDSALEDFRRAQQLRQREHQEYQRWQQRLHIAERLGARAVFETALPSAQPASSARALSGPGAVPLPKEQTREEKDSWNALERAREAIVEAESSSNAAAGSSSGGNNNTTTNNSRKRKARDDSPAMDPPVQPERRLKRPLTRRMVEPSEASSSKSPAPAQPQATGREQRNGSASGTASSAQSPRATTTAAALVEQPSFLSSLLKEMGSASDDESVRNFSGAGGFARPASNGINTNNHSSPATSPSVSAFSSPRALSLTPPPLGVGQGRPITPLSLSTHIQPIYRPANYSPSRVSPDGSDSEQRRPHQNGSPVEHQHQHQLSSRPQRNGHVNGTAAAEQRQPRPQQNSNNNNNNNNNNGSSPVELRQPRPQRQVRLPRSEETSLTRNLPYEMKQSISAIVRGALKPHWKSKQLTAEQYESINRKVSHKLYSEVSSPAPEQVDDAAKRLWESVATKEVARAMSDLKA